MIASVSVYILQMRFDGNRIVNWVGLCNCIVYIYLKVSNKNANLM